ncbi:MAG: type II toxin-antitoxin system VapC family toxin [Actinomycetota bacterium]
MRFVDSSYWIALQFGRDARHGDARALWQADEGPFVTTNHVAGETWTFLRRRLGFEAAVLFHRSVTRSPDVAVVHVDEDTEEEAWRWLRRHGERSYSFVDATSFAIMRRLRIREALTFDEDFEAAGFRLARP